MAARSRAKPRWMSCWLCRGRFFATGKGNNRVCLRPACERIAAAIRRVQYVERRGAQCLFCDSAPLSGRKVCARHQWRKEPCRTPDCTERVPYTDGQGNKRVYCVKCRPELHRAPPPHAARTQAVIHRVRQEVRTP